MKPNLNTASFCPHCGEDLRELAQPGPAPVSPTPPVPEKRVVLRREVTRQEIEALWGLMPLPFGIRAVGVVVNEGADLPLALVGEGKDGMVELRTGQVRQMGAEPSTAPEPTQQPTVPQLFASASTEEQKEEVGNSRYGGYK